MAHKKNESQALVAPEKVLVGDLILEARELPTKFDEMRSRANLITPVVEITSIAPHHAVNLSVVYIDPTVDENGNGPMCYRDKTFMAENERGLNKIGLDMVAAAAGISWLPHPHSRRTDDGKTPHVWAFTVVGAYTAMDGTVQTLPPGSVEVDLRDGSDQIGGWTQEEWEKLVESNKGKARANQKWTINGWSDKRVRQARRFGLQLAETKARLRAIRSLGIKQKFTADELRKPFVVPRVSFQPDMNNPVVAEIVTRQKLAGVSALFAQQQQALPPATEVAAIAAGSTPVHEDSPAEREPVERDFDEVEAEDAKKGTATSQAKPPEPKEYLIVKVSQDARDDQAFWITLDDEKRLLTLDRGTAKACNDWRKAGTRVEVVHEIKEFQGDDVLVIVEVTPVDEGL